MSLADDQTVKEHNLKEAVAMKSLEEIQHEQCTSDGE